MPEVWVSVRIVQLYKRKSEMHKYCNLKAISLLSIFVKCLWKRAHRMN